MCLKVCVKERQSEIEYISGIISPLIVFPNGIVFPKLCAFSVCVCVG